MSSSREPSDELTLIFGSRVLSKSSGMCLTWLLCRFGRILGDGNRVFECGENSSSFCYSEPAEPSLQSHVDATTQKRPPGCDGCRRVDRGRRTDLAGVRGLSIIQI